MFVYVHVSYTNKLCLNQRRAGEGGGAKVADRENHLGHRQIKVVIRISQSLHVMNRGSGGGGIQPEQHL